MLDREKDREESGKREEQNERGLKSILHMSCHLPSMNIYVHVESFQEITGLKDLVATSGHKLWTVGGGLAVSVLL